MSAIFISHSTKDNAIADKIKARLVKDGHRSVFLDFDPEDGIPAGRNWERELYARLRGCQAVVVLCSEHSMASRWCFAEIAFSRSLGKVLIPIKIGDCVIPSAFTDIQQIDFRADFEQGYQRLWLGLRQAGLDPAGMFNWDGSRPPYPGLMVFQEQDAAVYFGRGNEIQATVEKLNRMQRFGDTQLAVVLGASGSGKSSLLRAGVLPRLRRDSDRWFVLGTFRPLGQPVDRLATVLSAAFKSCGTDHPWQEIRDRLAQPATDTAAAYLIELVKDLRVASGRSEAALLLGIDQFEELLTSGGEDRFLKLLRTLVQAGNRSVILIATLRSDFLGKFQNHGILRGLAYEPIDLPQLPLEAFTEVIEGPARLAGLELEPGLAGAVVADAGTDDALPLLAFAMRELWEARGADGLLTIDQYRNGLGGLQGSVAKAADGIYPHRFRSPDEERDLRNAFLAMVRVVGGDYVRKPARWNELPESANAMLERFVQGRLLVSRGEGTDRILEVAHEALIRRWGKLRAWVEENREFLRTRERIASQVRLWEEEGRRPDRLLAPGRPLAEGEDLLATRRADLEENLVEYISASSATEAARQEATRAAQHRKLLRARLAAAAMLILAFVAVGFAHRWSIERQAARDAAATALTERDRADEARKVALVKQLTAQAELVLDQTASSLPLSMLLAAEAMKRAPSVELNQVLRQGLELLPQPVASIQHEGAAIAFSQDGVYLATASRDKTARIWRAANGQEVTRVAHDDEVNGVVFSPNGESFATCSKDGTVRLWQTMDGREVLRLTNPKSATAVTISPDGHFLAGIIGDNTARVWELPSGREVARLAHDDVVNAIAFRPDSRSIATASGYPSSHMISGAKLDDNARVWELPSGREILRVAHRHNVWAVSFSSDGRYLATASNDGTAQLWDVDARREVARLTHERPVSSIAFSADGRFLATAEGGFLRVGSGAYAVRIWEVPSGREVRRVTHESDVRAVLFSPDTSLLASFSGDGTARLWDVSGNEIARVVGDARDVAAMTFSPDGALFATASGGVVRVWKTSRPELIPFRGNALFGATFSPDGKYFAAVDSDDAAAVRDLSGRSEAIRLPLGGPIYSLAFSPDSRLVATAGADRVVRIWDRASGRAISQVAHDDAVNTVAFSPDSSLLATASKDNTARLWDAHGGSLVFRLAHNAPVKFVVFSPDGRFLATAEGDAVRLWELSTGREAVRLRHDKEVEAVVFSPTGKKLATTSWDRSVRVWDVASGHMISSVGHEKSVMAIAFSPDGLHVASAGGSTRIWEASNGRMIARLPQEGAWRLAFTRDGHYLATADLSRIARVWDAANGREIARVAHSSSVQRVAFDADGKQLLTVSGEILSNVGVARVSRWLPTDLIDEVCGRLTHNLSLAEWSQHFEAEPYQATCPDLPEHALDVLKQADNYALNGQRDLAEMGFVAAVQAGARAGKAEIDNWVCWLGAINKFAQIVMPACERAVALTDEKSRAYAQDRRGLARALTGNRQGAIEDFMAFARWAQEHEGHDKASEREAWIMTLRSGGDPFTAEKLKELRNE